MKTIIPMMICAIFSLAFNPTANYDSTTLSLQQLIKNPNFKVRINSNGNYSGSSVELTVSSKNIKSVKLSVPAGTLFYPEDGEEQTLVTPRDKIMAISPNKTTKVILHGFCTEASDRSPSDKGTFTVGSTKNQKLAKLLKFFKENKGISKHSVQ